MCAHRTPSMVNVQTATAVESVRRRLDGLHGVSEWRLRHVHPGAWLREAVACRPHMLVRLRTSFKALPNSTRPGEARAA
jgi:hypothetical protein